jgi:polyhydroxybutyrate depolymerase
MKPRALAALMPSFCALFLLGCQQPADAQDNEDLAGAPADDMRWSGATDMAPSDLIKARPYQSKIPAGYDPGKAWPLVILLHGYSSNGAGHDTYFGLSKIVDEKGFLYAYPDGTKDQIGNRFWNATDACCAFGKKVDDVAYLNAIIDDMNARYHVDSRRVFLIGHSNGGFMSHRMACDVAPRIAGIVSLAGANWKDAGKCQPTAPVAVLQVHGDADTTIKYGGGSNLTIPYPSAQDTVATWVSRNGCAATATAGAPRDLVPDLAGAETATEHHAGCRDNGAAELWTIRGGSHVPTLQPGWAAAIYDWLAAHPKK